MVPLVPTAFLLAIRRERWAEHESLNTDQVMSSHSTSATRRNTNASRKVAGRCSATGGSAKEVVTLSRDGHFTRIEPAVDELADVFYTLSHAVEKDQDHGCRITPWKAPLVNQQVAADGSQYQLCGAGLERLLEEHLRQHSYRVHKRGRRPGPLPAPSKCNLPRLHHVDPPVLDFVQQQERGLIRYKRSRKRLTQLVSQVAVAWPEANVLLCVSPGGDALTPEDCLWDMLLEMNPEADDSVYGTQVGNVWVGDYDDVADWLPDMEGPTILIVPEPWKLLQSKAGFQVLCQAQDARLFGLLPGEARLTQSERDEMTTFFGVREIDSEAEDTADRPARVAFVRYDSGPEIDRNTKTFELMRQGIWRNSLRNLRIAVLIRALVDHDQEQLQTHFPGVWRVLAGKPAGRIGVFVENVEHALVLAKSLRGWPVVASVRLHDEGLTHRERGILRAGRDEFWASKKNVIITADGLASAGQIDVLIRADAGVGQLPKIIYVNEIVIDLNDRHHPVLQKRAKQRRMAYQQQEWNVGGKTEMNYHLQQFLATRPQLKGSKRRRGRK